MNDDELKLLIMIVLTPCYGCECLSGCRDRHDRNVVEVEKASLLEGDVSDDYATTHTSLRIYMLITLTLRYYVNFEILR